MLSCSSDDGNKNEPELPSSSSIVGHWIWLMEHPMYGTFGQGITFEQDGTGYFEWKIRDDSHEEENPYDYIYEREDFTYSYKNGTLTMTVQGITSSGRPVINNDILYLSDQEEADNNIPYTRSAKNLKETLGI